MYGKSQKVETSHNAAKTTTQIMKWIDLILCPEPGG
jgi:hypothetical protein